MEDKQNGKGSEPRNCFSSEYKNNFDLIDWSKKPEFLIFGSTAMKHWFPEFREPSDLDLISKKKEMSKTRQSYWVDSFQYILDNNKDSKYVDPEYLLTIKMSHAGWNIHWSKTMFDINFLKGKGFSVNKPLYKSLVKDWSRVHGKAWAPLKNESSESFFDDAVSRKYIHDDIHEAVAYYDSPLYYKILKDKESGSVECSEKKFDQLSHEDKILLVKEEVWVTALERFLIPKEFKYPKVAAYGNSLKKLATTMSSGWFKFWILDNFSDLMKMTDDELITSKFKQAEKEGKIRRS